MGPIPRNKYNKVGSIFPRKKDSSCILPMVIAKPIELVMVRAVPLNSAGAAAATIVENCGESDITTIPQIHSAKMKNCSCNPKSRGDTKQKIPEINKER